MDKDREIINVHVQTFRTKNGSEYSNIYINGVQIMKGHKETHVKTFLDDSVLGIYGIVTDNKYLSKTPQWLVYRNSDAKPIALDASALCNMARPSANIINAIEVGPKLHLITDTRAHMSCKKSPDANYKFEIIRTYITGNIRRK